VELIQTHFRPGPGPVRVEAPDLPVEITVLPDLSHRRVHVLADKGLGAHAGPGGAEGREMRIFVGRPGMGSWVAILFGLRRGSSVSAGSVSATGKGSVVSGGSIRHAVTGDGARMMIDGEPVRRKGPGVHLSVPPGCTFDIRKHDGITVHYDGTEMTIEAAIGIGILERA
jgi:hypothetical protein